MPNLMLTNWCNYKCSYCFGVDMMAPAVPAMKMTKETFNGIINWLDKEMFAGKEIHLMGGEPTLNDHFEYFIERLMDEEYRIVVFSNLASPKGFYYADKLSYLPIHWVVNVNPPHSWNEKQKERILSSLKALGKRASITFNIMPDDPDNEWAIDLINTYGLAKTIKVGFVLPTLTGSNYALQQDQYHLVAQKVVELAENANKYDIRLEYECGVPWCAFTPDQLGELWKNNSAINSHCDSIMDITPDGKIIYCLPLATMYAKPYSDFETYLEAKMWFEKKFGVYRPLGQYKKCQSCMLMQRKKCRGGCLAKILSNTK